MCTKHNTKATAEATNCEYILSDTSKSDASCSYSTRENGRALFREPGGEVLNVARLTAYAEHGKDIFDKVVHHEIPGYKIDIPEFLCPISRPEHTKFHKNDPEPVYEAGIPLLCPKGMDA